MSIAIIDLHPNHTISIESISVTKGKCLLSGAWDLPLMEAKKISDIVSGKLVIPLGDYNAFTNYFSGIQLEIVEASSFLHDAVLAAQQAIQAYEIYKGEDIVKRKKLVAPDFYDWPTALDFNDSSRYLESIGKFATSTSTPDHMKKTLSAARLVQHLIEMWQLDEQERSNRKYVLYQDAEFTIVPKSWLNTFSIE